MNLYIDTCVLPRCALEEAALYRERCGPEIGFELLPMFDLPDFEDNLCRNLELFADGPLTFHEPVWGVEHTAPPGSAAYEESMYHLRLTAKYAEILHPTHLVCHLNNCVVPPEEKERMLSVSLENLEQMRDMFRDIRLLVENTGTVSEGTVLLDQAEFTALCRDRDLDVMIDVGHANANGWDLADLIGGLRNQIRGFHFHNNDGCHDLHDRIGEGSLDFDRLMPLIRQCVPEALWVIEYIRPSCHGKPLLEDIARMRIYAEEAEKCQM